MVRHCIVKKKREDPVIRWTRNKKGQVDVTPKKKPASKETSKQSFNTRLAHRVDWYVPRFARTRRVVIKKQHGVWVAECTCKHYIRHEKACRHVYAILKRHPKVTDATIRHWNIYHRDFKKDPALTKKMMEIKKTKLTGVPIELEDLITEGRGRPDKEFYTEALGVVVLKGPSYWTEVKGYKVMSDPNQNRTRTMDGFGVVSETGLSERQQAINEQEETEDPFPVPMDVDGSDNLDYFVDEGGETDDVTMEDAEAGNKGEATEYDPNKAYRSISSICLGICQDIQTPEEFERFRKLLVEHRRLLAQEHAPAEAQHNPQGMASLPEVQTSRAEKRITAVLSPSRRDEKKKRR